MNGVMENKFGSILKCPDYINEFWYISPVDKKRKLITFTNARSFFKKIIVPVEEKMLIKIPLDSDVDNKKNIVFRKKLKGRFVSLKEEKFQIWYVDDKLKRHVINDFDFFDILGAYAKEISREELELIPE